MTILKAITELNIDEIKEDFGDCDWMRGVLNGYTVDAILWLIHRVEELEMTWISVKDRLPEISYPVLTWFIDCNGHGGYQIDGYDGEMWIEAKVWDGSVTHWMPMPEPPERG